MKIYTIKLSPKESIEFQGICVADVAALNHDDAVRRRFRLYKRDNGFIAERIDDPGTIDDRYWGAECDDILAIYDFFGNEPLANYLYGVMGFDVPGLKCMDKGLN